jgi:hypothetical protein
VGEIEISSLYECDKCTTYDKKIKGCKRNRRSVVVFDCACVCGGRIKCPICGGIKRDNTIRVRRCPRAILKEHVSRIVPYFYRFINSDFMEYPDGRGMIYQPKKLVNAFDILTSIYQKEKKKNAKD